MAGEIGNSDGPMDIGRRPLLKGTAALLAATVMPGWRQAQAVAARPYDVIVIGGGTAGMPLAITAAEGGARVLVIEKAPILGGTLDRSAASTSGAGTIFQRQHGIQDTPQEHFADIMRSTQDIADPVLTRLWTNHAGETVNWLVDRGVKFTFYPKRSDKIDAVYRNPRSQVPVGAQAEAGKAMLRGLEPSFNRVVATGAVTVQLNSRAVELIQDAKGAVVGVVVEDETGKRHDFPGRNVVLTAGGCQGSPAMYESLHKVPLYWAAGYPMNTGDGVLLGQSVGGYVRGAEGYIPIFGVVMSDDLIPSSPLGGTFQETTITGNVQGRPPWEIWVNSDGERFVEEDSEVPQRRERALGRQPGHRMWSIHDHTAFEKAPSPLQGWSRDQYVDQFEKSSMFYKADTLEQLAVEAGISPSALVANVKDYNRGIAEGSPDRFGRTHRPSPIAKAPFYAVRYQGYHLLTFAGLVVDENLQVVRRDGSRVPNLFAAGEVLGATAVGCNAHAGGSMVTPAITFARLLGARLSRATAKGGRAA